MSDKIVWERHYSTVLAYRPNTAYWRWRLSVKRDLLYILPIICRPLVRLERWLRLLRP
jgi:hypothetical protein